MLFVGWTDNETVLEYTRGIDNTLGIRLGEEMTPNDLLNAISRMNPMGERGGADIRGTDGSPLDPIEPTPPHKGGSEGGKVHPMDIRPDPRGGHT